MKLNQLRIDIRGKKKGVELEVLEDCGATHSGAPKSISTGLEGEDR
jgi:hypothetical protein